MAMIYIIPPIAVAAPYVGLGDLLTATHYWGFRAYSAATIGANAIRLVRASDSAQQDFVTVAGGGLDTASISTFLAATSGKIVTLYDQVGSSHATQGTDAARPAYTASASGSRPGGTWNSGASTVLQGSAITQAQVFSVIAAAKYTGSGEQNFLGTTADHIQFSANPNGANANQWFIWNGGSKPAATAAANAFHSGVVVFNDSSSLVDIDGAADSPQAIGSTQGITAQSPRLGASGGANFLDGVILELAIAASDQHANRVAISANQHAYWGF